MVKNPRERLYKLDIFPLPPFLILNFFKFLKASKRGNIIPFPKLHYSDTLRLASQFRYA